jgi:flagellar P-ring protein precursor FlgI
MHRQPERLMRLTVLIAFLAASAALWWPHPAAAARLKELGGVQGVRSNPLVGYGLVVGLDGTGDQTTQAPFTTQSVIAMLQQMGVSLPPGASLQLKNIAAVLVTADLPPSARTGRSFDVTVSSMGNAKSLRGGTLITTPLRGADGQIYALAQGNLIVGGAGASANGSKVQINHLSAGRIPQGATVERELPSVLNSGDSIIWALEADDFRTATEVARVINAAKGAGTAEALDGRAVSVRLPAAGGARTAFLADLENLSIELSRPAARVVLNLRTGSVVMNDAVTIGSCAVAHGSLSVVISTTPQVSQPNPLAQGSTTQVDKSDIAITQQGSSLVQMPAGAKLADVVRALNSLGATPMDLQAILQAMKRAGALNAEIETI